MPEHNGDDGSVADRDLMDRNAGPDEEGLVAPNSPGSAGSERPAIVVASANESEAPVGPAAELGTTPAQPKTDTESGGHEERWHFLGAEFIDDPRGSVAEAAELVKTEVTALIAHLSRRQEALGEKWQTTEPASDSSAGTEQLRLAFRAYRDFGRQIAAGRNALS